MKKTFTSIVVSIVAIASFGGNIISLAHAQSASVITPGQAAALQVQLDALKTKLLQLQAEQSSLSASPAQAGAPSVMTGTSAAAILSSSDIAALNSAFTSLTAVLTSLEAQITKDPQFLATHGAVIAASLGNIANALLATSKALPAGPVASAPAAISSPNAGSQSGSGTSVSVKVNPSPSEGPSPLLSANQGRTSPETPAASETTGNNAETAQASSVFSSGSLNWPLILVVLLAVAAIAIWLWWPSESEEEPQGKGNKKGATPKPFGKAPVAQPTITVASAHGNMPTVVTTPAKPSGAPTPLSSVVATPVPKPGMPPMDPKRKSA